MIDVRKWIRGHPLIHWIVHNTWCRFKDPVIKRERYISMTYQEFKVYSWWYDNAFCQFCGGKEFTKRICNTCGGYVPRGWQIAKRGFSIGQLQRLAEEVSV